MVKIIKRPLESAKGKPLRWAVMTGEKGHLLAMFVSEQHARNFAAGRHAKVEEIKK